MRQKLGKIKFKEMVVNALKKLDEEFKKLN